MRRPSLVSGDFDLSLDLRSVLRTIECFIGAVLPKAMFDSVIDFTDGLKTRYASFFFIMILKAGCLLSSPMLGKE